VRKYAGKSGFERLDLMRVGNPRVGTYKDSAHDAVPVYFDRENCLYITCTALFQFVLLCRLNFTRRTIMAKGQQRKNKEAKKPKKKPTPAI